VAGTLPDYDELEIRLTPGRTNAYNVEIAAASGAHGYGTFAAPSELEVERFRMTVDPRSRQVRGRSRYLAAATQFGQGLFDALVADASVRDVYSTARRDALAARRGLRVTLSLRAAPELAGIPWEYLYHRPWFLAQNPRTPVVRFVDLEDPPPPLRVAPPLRILGMVSRPKDDALAELDAEEEQAKLERRLGPAIEAGHVALRWLERATLPALQQEADHGENFHVFHYIGHGEYDRDTSESSLVLERADRRPHRVGGQQLGALLCGRGSLRLAVLNACETAQTAPQDPLAGVATSLLEYDVPAVVAMQFAITDDGALTFADEFYRSLASGYAVDAAVTQARRALAAHSDVEWGTPVLFMRVADGRLFDIQPAPPTEDRSAPPPATPQRPRQPTSVSPRDPQRTSRAPASSLAGPDVAVWLPSLVGRIVAGLSAVLLLVSLWLRWDKVIDTDAWQDPAKSIVLLVLAAVVLMLAVLRSTVPAGGWTTALAATIVLAGLLAEDRLVLESRGVGGGRYVAILASVGIALGGWLMLEAEAGPARREPPGKELLAAVGGLAITGSLWLPWTPDGDIGWKFTLTDIMLATLTGMVILMALARRTVPGVGGSPVAALVLISLGAILTERVTRLRNLTSGTPSRLPWEAGRYVALAGALLIILGGALSLSATLKRRGWRTNGRETLPS
jgi:hypothetical protein